MKFYFDGEIHSIVDLSMRDVTGDKGSLCGMASLYQAAQQTILTLSQIKQMSYDDVKAKLGETLGLNSVNTKKENDVDLIKNFHDRKFWLLTKPSGLIFLTQCTVVSQPDGGRGLRRVWHQQRDDTGERLWRRSWSWP